MWRALFILLLCSNIALADKANEPIDVLTLTCLAGIGSDPNPEACIALSPELRQQVMLAHDSWLKRNKTRLSELESACKTILLRAYDNNETRITRDKQKVRQYQEEMMRRWREKPDPNRINCRAYIEDFSKGNDKVDIQPWLIKQILEHKARPMDWSNLALEADPP